MGRIEGHDPSAYTPLHMPGKLSFVATPIGNLGDISQRALQTLAACDVIVCEDTRVTSKLLAAYHISKPLRSLHERSEGVRIDQLLEQLEQGKHLVYVSDAGTPGVNDPGGKLAEAAYGQGILIEPIPGPSALSAAISVCGFPMEHFAYLGFVPHKKGRKSFFEDIASRKAASVFFESPHRIMKTLDGLLEAVQITRLIFIGRELTKMHETLYRGTIAEVKNNLVPDQIRGEFVVIVGPALKR